MKNFAIVFSLSLLVLLGFNNPLVIGNPAGKQRQQIEALNQRLEQNLLKSNQHIEKGEFQQAELYTDELLNDLDILIDALMPLDERINQLIENEEIILKQTQNIENVKSTGQGRPELDKKLEDLVFEQIKNREKTSATSKITSKQLDAIKNQPMEKGGNKTADSSSIKKALQEVKKLLDKSTSYQTAAIDDLEERKYLPAKLKEQNALDTLKKALEKLRQNAKSQPGSQNSAQSGQQQDQKQKSAANQQPQNQGEEKNQQNQNIQAKNQEKKMDAKEALKELLKLRKQAREEQERRRREYGVQAPGEKYPVEKDW